MLKFLSGFLLLQLLYHVIVVGVSYGIHWISQTHLAILRDVIWILMIGGFFLWQWKSFMSFFRSWWRECLFFLLIVILSVLESYFWFGKSFQDILIGIKYGLWYWGIFLMAIGFGWIWSQKKQKSDSFSFNFSKVFAWSLTAVVVLGWIWQFLKLLFPDWFYGFGYGGLDDFHFGANPPLYYLTGFEGTMRWQGLFAGPNNYGYFLVAFLPVILSLFPLSFKALNKRSTSDLISFLIQVLWFLTIAFTLSRAALIGLFVVLILHYWKVILSHKRTFLGLGIVFLMAIAILSFWKWESTSIHILKKLEGFQEVFLHPLGYGLGSSGPAVHHQGNFLPENYYVQMMLDIGIPGFLLWLLMILSFFFKESRVLRLCKEKQFEKSDFYLLYSALRKGFIALLVIGLFLHVFEDSMVNYVFFIAYGFVMGGLSLFAFSD